MKTKIEQFKISLGIACMSVLFSFNYSLQAQVVYTDIPDATPSANYTLDLNNDQTADFIFQFDLTDKIVCKPLSNNAYSGDYVGGVYLPWAKPQSSNICDTLVTWYGNTNPGAMAWGTNIGYWIGQTDKYIALKLVVGANTHYGWARFDVLPSSTSFTIKDYAYESTPNACIQTGQTNLALVENVFKPLVVVYPNPATKTIHIKSSQNLAHATLQICNSTGQVVKQLENISGHQIQFNTDNLPPSLYFIQLIENNTILSVQKCMVTE